MATKRLAIKSEVYDELLKIKKENESFSQLFERLLKHKTDIMAFAGKWKADLNAAELKKDAENIRKNAIIREF